MLNKGRGPDQYQLLNMLNKGRGPDQYQLLDMLKIREGDQTNINCKYG